MLPAARLIAVSHFVLVLTTQAAGLPMDTQDQVLTALGQAGPGLYQEAGEARDRFELRLADGGFRGMALAAPARGDDGQLVLASQQTVSRGWAVGMARNLKLAIIDDETGELLVVPAFQDAKEAAAASKPPAPTGAAADAIETAVQRLGLDRLAPGAMTPSRRRITALAYDQRSNSILITLPGIAAPSGPPMISPLPEPVSGDGTSYALAIDPIASTSPGFSVRSADGNLVLSGTLATTLEPTELWPAQTRVRDQGTEYSVHAVIALGIAIVGPDQHQARTWNLGIPVYQQSAAGTRSASQFRIVLSDPAACALPAGSLAYLFVGDRVEGPLPVAGP